MLPDEKKESKYMTRELFSNQTYAEKNIPFAILHSHFISKICFLYRLYIKLSPPSQIF